MREIVRGIAGPMGCDAEFGGAALEGAEFWGSEQVFRFRANDVAVIVSKNEFAQIALATLLTEMGASELTTGRSVELAVAQLSDRQNVVVAVLDLPLPSLEAQTIVAIRTRFPAARVVVVSDSRDSDGALIALAKGAHGYIPKSLGTAEFRRALAIVEGGAIYAPADR